MTSHIFVALGMWPEVIDANLKAIAVANAARAAAGKSPSAAATIRAGSVIWIPADERDE